MPGTKKGSLYRKSRKGKGFSGVPEKGKSNETEQANVITNHEASTSTCSSPAGPAPSGHTSVSRKKLSARGFEDSPAKYEGSTSGYRLVDLNEFSTLLSEVHDCTSEGSLRAEETGKAGLKSDVSLQCNKCVKSFKFETSYSITPKGKSYDVNRRAVYHAVESGGGYEGLQSFCSMMNMPCMTKGAYYKQLDVILSALEKEAKDEMEKAADRLRAKVFLERGEDDDGGIVDVAVSFDGTWAKRGFTSQTGVMFVISVDTGEVLDYHVLSKSCQKCSLKQSKCSDEEFKEWQLEHLASGECDMNFEGSSPAMESEGAVVIWKRSIEFHKMRYLWMVSDGDSKAFGSVEHTYEDCVVEKLDCVGHVQKRMGKRLLNLKAITKGKLSDGKTIGGRGRLTEAKIKQIQKYYGLAIRQNTIKTSNPTEKEVEITVYKMKKNIIAILHHIVKLDDQEKQHRFCPRGESSWCKWQQDVATGTKTYKNDNCLPAVFLEVMRPVFMSLSESSLLTRCVHGITQNQNESINALVWIRCPKHKHHRYKAVRCAVASAVCHFHGGSASQHKVMERLLIPAGDHKKAVSAVKDRKRVRKADKAATEKDKKRRRTEKILNTQREEALREIEGVSYEAGGF